MSSAAPEASPFVDTTHTPGSVAAQSSDGDAAGGREVPRGLRTRPSTENERSTRDDSRSLGRDAADDSDESGDEGREAGEAGEAGGEDGSGNGIEDGIEESTVGGAGLG